MPIEPEQAGSLLESLVSLARTTRIIAHRDAERSVSGTRMALLQVLRDDDPRLGDLATRLRVKPSVASRAAQALESEGLVARIADPADARACRIHLTDAGRTHLLERQARALRLVSQTFDDFSTEEAEQSIALLQRLESAVVEWVGHLDRADAQGIDPLSPDALLKADPEAAPSAEPESTSEIEPPSEPASRSVHESPSVPESPTQPEPAAVRRTTVPPTIPGRAADPPLARPRPHITTTRTAWEKTTA